MTVSSKKTVDKRGRPINPKSLQNLADGTASWNWKPGQGGNVKGYSLKSRLLDALVHNGKLEPQCIGDEIVLSTIEGAKLREPAPFREVWDRCEGKQTSDDKPPPANVQVIFVIGKGYAQTQNAIETHQNEQGQPLIGKVVESDSHVK